MKNKIKKKVIKNLKLILMKFLKLKNKKIQKKLNPNFQKILFKFIINYKKNKFLKFYTH